MNKRIRRKLRKKAYCDWFDTDNTRDLKCRECGAKIDLGDIAAYRWMVCKGDCLKKRLAELERRRWWRS